MLLAQLITSIGQFLYAALTARAFPPATFGAFAAALSLQGVITLITTTGLPSYVLKIAELTKKTAFRIRWMAFFGGVFAALLFAVLNEPWLRLLQAEEGGSFFPALLLAQAAAPLATVESAIMRRQGRADKDALCLVSAFVVANGAGAVSISISGSPWTLALATALYPGALYILSRILGRAPLGKGDPASVSDVVSFSRKITTQNVVFLLLQQLPTWVISARAGSENLGFFARAGTLAGMPATATSTAVNRALQPHWRKLSSPAGADRASEESAILASALAFPLFTLLAVNASPIIEVWLGSGWAPAASFVPILAISYGLSIPFAVVANSAEMRGLFMPVRIAQLAMGIGVLPGLFLLIRSGDPLWGAGAMAVSQLCGLLTLIIKLPWSNTGRAGSTLIGIGGQLVWSVFACGVGYLVWSLARGQNLVLFDAVDWTQLVVVSAVSTAVWFITFRWNRAYKILQGRRFRGEEPVFKVEVVKPSSSGKDR